MIYLDANATAKLRPAARSAIEEIIAPDSEVKNPSSIHRSGRRARGLLAAARASLLDLLCGEERKGVELVFTSGGTEACNAMVRGFLGDITRPAHIVASSIEHPAVLEELERLRRGGWQVEFINPASDGVVAVESICNAVRADTALVCLMAANNETGALQPVKALAERLRAEKYYGVIVSDCTQALGKTKLLAPELFNAGVNAISISGHKVGALPGIGALVYSTAGACFEFQPLLVGGPQESRFRAGTENLPGIVSFGAASRELMSCQEEEQTRLSALREQLWRQLQCQVPIATRLTPKNSLPNTLLVRFAGLRGDDLVVGLDLAGVAASTGSACASGKQDVSHVLSALGLSESDAREVVRFSLDWDADEELILEAAATIAAVVHRMSQTDVLAAGAVA